MPANWMRPRFTSLRVRMALVLICVLLLPCGYAILQAFLVYQEHRAWRIAALERTARLISSHQSEFFFKTRLLLDTLADNPGIASGHAPACAELLQTELQKTNDFRNFAVTDQDGVVRCSTASQWIGMGQADRSSFRHLRAGATFAVSEVVSGRDGGGRTVLVGVRLPNAADGRFAGTLAANINLSVLSARMRTLSLPADALALLTDQHGELLATSEQLNGWPTREQIVQLISNSYGANVARSDNHIERRFITAPIQGAPLYVVLGLPILDDWSSLERNLLLALFAPSVMLALAIVATWIATDLLVNRHVAALARTAQSYGGGRFTGLPPLRGAPGELRDLAAALARMARRIGEREEELRQSLQQKDVLLREIHHRVKNNLQIVTSLLNLRIQAIPSRAAQDAMLEAQTRIKALALVHRSLYEHYDVDRVDLAALIGELCQLLHDGAEATHRQVTLKLDLAPVEVTTEKAIPITLLVTECVSNSLKHAFPDGQGTIEVRLVCDSPACRLTVSDDGIGIEASRRAQAEADSAPDGTAGSVGLRLIEMFAKQIGGRLQIEGPPGTTVVVAFDI
jgi:two-component sensor histidine kinase